MKRTRHLLLAILTISLVLAAFPVCAATTSKEITKISIKVSATYTVGGTIPGTIGIGSNSGEDVEVSVSGSEYQIDNVVWVTSDTKELKIGDTPKMKVFLSEVNEDVAHFKKTYSSSTVSVSKGTFVEVYKRDSQFVVVLETEGVKGTYDAPENCWWEGTGLGHAAWAKPDVGSGTYEIQLFCDGKSVHKVSSWSGRTYNFYPYMTKAGDYTFKVRTVAATTAAKKYATTSDWMESDLLTISESYVSDGSGKATANTSGSSGSSSSSSNVSNPSAGPKDAGIISAGWQNEGGYWKYRLPTGDCQKNCWMQYGGSWYRFDPQGRMMTGWYTAEDKKQYYLTGTGEMAKGWMKIGNRWRFFVMDGASEGVLYTNGWLNAGNGTWYYIDKDGLMSIGWVNIDGNYRYFYPKSDDLGHKEGQMAVNTVIEGFYVDSYGIWRH